MGGQREKGSGSAYRTTGEGPLSYVTVARLKGENRSGRGIEGRLTSKLRKQGDGIRGKI